jgi:hypothetical protein
MSDPFDDWNPDDMDGVDWIEHSEKYSWERYTQREPDYVREDY